MITMKIGPRAALALGTVLIAGPAAAALHVTKHETTMHADAVSPKTIFAGCDQNQLIVGGGAWVLEDNEVGQVLLTQLQPIHSFQN